jgi:antitoxin (DNA-binding transcriptional repressor) of toxin-antitoxin stability system
MRTVDLPDAQVQLADLVDEVLAGEDVAIAREGTLVIQLIPLLPQQPRIFGLDQGKIHVRDDFDAPMPELERLFYGDPDPDDPA